MAGRTLEVRGSTGGRLDRLNQAIGLAPAPFPQFIEHPLALDTATSGRSRVDSKVGKAAAITGATLVLTGLLSDTPAEAAPNRIDLACPGTARVDDGTVFSNHSAVVVFSKGGKEVADMTYGAVIGGDKIAEKALPARGYYSVKVGPQEWAIIGNRAKTATTHVRNTDHGSYQDASCT